MATGILRKKTVQRVAPIPKGIPRAVREQVTTLLVENYAYMDSPVFKRKNIERELFSENSEPELPLTSWYQPTRDDASEISMGGAPQLMKPQEERIMFLRYNYAKLRLQRLQKKIQAN